MATVPWSSLAVPRRSVRPSRGGDTSDRVYNTRTERNNNAPWKTYSTTLCYVVRVEFRVIRARYRENHVNTARVVSVFVVHDRLKISNAYSTLGRRRTNVIRSFVSIIFPARLIAYDISARTFNANI